MAPPFGGCVQNDGGDREDDDGGGSVATTEPADDIPDVECNSPDSEGSNTVHDTHKRQRSDQTSSLDVSPALEAELKAFDEYRAAPLNRHRSGSAVVSATRASDRARILRFLSWLRASGRLNSRPTLAVFSHAKVGAAAQQYVKMMVEEKRRKYSYVTKIAGSLVAVARFAAFTAAQRGSAEGESLAELSALHLQCRNLGSQQDRFDVGKIPSSFLDWDGVQRARCNAEQKLAALPPDADEETGDRKLELTRDILILRLLARPPT